MKESISLDEAIGKTIKGSEVIRGGLLIAYEGGDHTFLLAEGYCNDCDLAYIADIDEVCLMHLDSHADILKAYRLEIIDAAERDELLKKYKAKIDAAEEQDKARQYAEYLRLKAIFEPAPLPEEDWGQ